MTTEIQYPYAGVMENKPLDTCSNSDLATIQRALEWLIYSPGPIDGLYGKKTATAWTEFKETNGLGNPDWIGPQSSELLNDSIERIESILTRLKTTMTPPIADTQSAIIALASLMRLPYESHSAYIFATTQWETAGAWQPVKEAYWVNDAEAWRERNLRYWPWYGRGFVQLTWEDNYKKYGAILGMPLAAEPDLACRVDVALFVLIHGFSTGLFTGRKLIDYVKTEEPVDFVNARKCINGNDKKYEIAALADQFYGELDG